MPNFPNQRGFSTLLTLTLVVVVGGGLWFFLQDGEMPAAGDLDRVIPQVTNVFEELGEELSPEQEQSPDHLSVDYLRARAYEGSEIVIDQTLFNNGTFTSYLAHYTSDGLRISALLNIPNTASAENKLPVVIVNHGYINPPDYSTTQSYATITDFYAENGFISVKPDYRCHGQSECGDESRVEQRFSYTIDVLNLIESLDSLKNADTNKIYAYGHSMGGSVTLRAIEVTDKFSAVSFWAPAVTDYPESHEYFIRGNRDSEAYKEFVALLEEFMMDKDVNDFSTISDESISYVNTPILVHYGTADESVPFSWGEDLAKLLGTSNKVYELQTYPGEDHNFRNGSWGTVAARDLEWFNAY